MLDPRTILSFVIFIGLDRYGKEFLGDFEARFCNPLDLPLGSVVGAKVDELHQVRQVRGAVVLRIHILWKNSSGLLSANTGFHHFVVEVEGHLVVQADHIVTITSTRKDWVDLSLEVACLSV